MFVYFSASKDNVYVDEKCQRLNSLILLTEIDVPQIQRKKKCRNTFLSNKSKFMLYKDKNVLADTGTKQKNTHTHKGKRNDTTQK